MRKTLPSSWSPFCGSPRFRLWLSLKTCPSTGIALCQEQRAAVELALTNKLSLILGGAGCGKSTLIRAIVNMVGAGHSMVLCAPTGKAARNLEKRTGCRPTQFTVPSECTRTRTFWLL